MTAPRSGQPTSPTRGNSTRFSPSDQKSTINPGGFQFHPTVGWHARPVGSMAQDTFQARIRGTTPLARMSLLRWVPEGFSSISWIATQASRTNFPPTHSRLVRSAAMTEALTCRVSRWSSTPFLIGCGSVMQGWAYTIRRLPVRGRARAVDPDFLGVENLGPYVLAWQTDIGREKVRILADALGPAIAVSPDRDFVEFLEMRIAAGLAVPPIVIAGLNDPAARHVVQRWWPDQLIDMATDGLNSQVIVKGRADDGTCLVEAIPVNPAVPSTLAQRAASVGLSIERVLADPTGAIGEADLGAADEAQRGRLQVALNAGMARCSRILAQELDPTSDPAFGPAAPFVASFTGTLAAGITMRRLSGARAPLHVQRSFQSERSRRLALRAAAECECQHAPYAGSESA